MSKLGENEKSNFPGDKIRIASTPVVLNNNYASELPKEYQVCIDTQMIDTLSKYARFGEKTSPTVATNVCEATVPEDFPESNNYSDDGAPDPMPFIPISNEIRKTISKKPVGVGVPPTDAILYSAKKWGTSLPSQAKARGIYSPEKMKKFSGNIPESKELLELFKDSVRVNINPEGITIVYAICVNTESRDSNKISYLKCNGANRLPGFAYHRDTDSVIVKCADVLELGYIPCSCKLTFDSMEQWEISVPLPILVLEKNMTMSQLEMLYSFKKQYENSKYKIEFVQMTSCN